MIDVSFVMLYLHFSLGKGKIMGNDDEMILTFKCRGMCGGYLSINTALASHLFDADGIPKEGNQGLLYCPNCLRWLKKIENDIRAMNNRGAI